jgi:hypothetical protein
MHSIHSEVGVLWDLPVVLILSTNNPLFFLDSDYGLPFENGLASHSYCGKQILAYC